MDKWTSKGKHPMRSIWDLYEPLVAARYCVSGLIGFDPQTGIWLHYPKSFGSHCTTFVLDIPGHPRRLRAKSEAAAINKAVALLSTLFPPTLALA